MPPCYIKKCELLIYRNSPHHIYILAVLDWHHQILFIFSVFEIVCTITLSKGTNRAKMIFSIKSVRFSNSPNFFYQLHESLSVKVIPFIFLMFTQNPAISKIDEINTEICQGLSILINETC